MGRDYSMLDAGWNDEKNIGEVRVCAFLLLATLAKRKLIF
jgi:hypothetical protein